MKLLSIILILFSLQSWTKADDIRDFQIEGMSIGDSALRFYSEKEILNHIRYDYYDDDLYYTTELKIKSKKFDGISLIFLSEDKNYIIKGIAAHKFIDANKCLKQRNTIKKEMIDVWPNTSSDEYSRKHPADKTGNSVYHHILYRLYDNEKIIGNAVIECLDWTKELNKNKGWTDNLNLRITLEDFEKWLRTKAYK